MDSNPICSKLNNYTAKQHITQQHTFQTRTVVDEKVTQVVN